MTTLVEVTITGAEWHSMAFDPDASLPAWREMFRLGRMLDHGYGRRTLTAYLPPEHAEVIAAKFPLALQRTFAAQRPTPRNAP